MKRILMIVLAAFATTTIVLAQAPRSIEAQFKAAQHKEGVEGDLRGAIEQYARVAQGTDRALAARALIRMADCYQKLGDSQARNVYERLVREFSDQTAAAAEARAFLSSLQMTAVPQTRQIARQIWAGRGVDGGGTPSPDGRYLSFTDWDTGDLAVRDLTKNTTRRLTNTGGWVASGDYASESVVSPDGRQVAYAWFVENEFKNELRVLSLATDNPARPRVILRTERNDYSRPVAWTPDGTQLVVLRSLPDKTNQIGIVAVQDGSYRSIKSLEWRYPRRLSLSPDGQHLAYDVPAGDNGSARDILALATNGSRETTVVGGPANDSSPLWSPDGSQLLFLSDRTGNNALWTIPVEAGQPKGSPVLAKADVGPMSLLGITKNGLLHYFVPGSSRKNLYIAGLSSMKASSSPSVATESFVNGNLGPAWSHDGEYLAYYSLRNPPVLVVRSAKTSDERVIPLPAAVTYPFNTGPKWFPDGRSLLVLSADAQGTGVGFYRLVLETGQTELLFRINRGTSSYDLSADGKTIFYVLQHAISGKLMRFDIDSGRETELKKDEWFITVAASPDGSQVAYVKSIRKSLGTGPSGPAKPTDAPSVVEVMPAAGGPSREAFRSGNWYGGARYNALAWSPDQRFILFVQDDGALWRVPVSGGEAQQVGISMKARIKSPAVHPDGTRIVFAAVDQDNSEVWTLENFLPAAVSAKK